MWRLGAACALHFNVLSFRSSFLACASSSVKFLFDSVQMTSFLGDKIDSVYANSRKVTISFENSPETIRNFENP